MDLTKLKTLLLEGSPDFWPELRRQSDEALGLEALLALSNLRKRAEKPIGLKPLRASIIGGFTFQPLTQLLEHFFALNGFDASFFVGQFDGDKEEILNQESGLHASKPSFVLYLPGPGAFRETISMSEDYASGHAKIGERVEALSELCQTLERHTAATVFVGNFQHVFRFDPGAIRSRRLCFDWAYWTCFNQELSRTLPSSIQICDLEYLSSRLGLQHVEDRRLWFESKQIGSFKFQIEMAKDVVHQFCTTASGPKKLLITDLDDTLWGGVIGDDGLEGIELGENSPKGQAFRGFQRYLLDLKNRGTLLSVCSKNEEENALMPFEKHPEMLLKRADFVSFFANWKPKPENIINILRVLNLLPQSTVFIDDNAAEIAAVKSTFPEMTCILLKNDPSERVGQMQDSRLFEITQLTQEDFTRHQKYQAEQKREEFKEKSMDLPSYLKNLEMKAQFIEFRDEDVPRIAQLVNKTNQFNLTTKRQSESDLRAELRDSNSFSFSVRLSDKFGDHGLIGVVILKKQQDCMRIDSWLMSCRVFNRELEFETMNEIIRLSKKADCDTIEGKYFPTKKNIIVKDLYTKLGFQATNSETFILKSEKFNSRATFIEVERGAYDKTDFKRASGDF